MQKTNTNRKYESPIIQLLMTDLDIITYSETEEWEGPVISAGLDDSYEN